MASFLKSTLLCSMLAIGLLLSFASSAESFKYVVYVDPSHPNASSHSEGAANAPFKTLKAAIRWAIDLWDSEENVKIIVAPGVYKEALFLVDHKVPNQLLITSSTNLPVIVDGTGVTAYEKSLVSSKSLFHLFKTENVTFQNFTFTRSENDAGVELVKSKNIQFINCKFVSNNNKGIRLDDARAITFSQCEVSGNAIGVAAVNSKGISFDGGAPEKNQTDISADAKSEIKTK